MSRHDHAQLSPWWKNTLLLLLIGGFSVLIAMAASAYRNAPPIPGRILDPRGNVLATADDIRSGQQVFLKRGLMENGTVWGHGAYLGPDYPAQYLHQQTLDCRDFLARERRALPWDKLAAADQDAIQAEVLRSTRLNRYDPASDSLALTAGQAYSFAKQPGEWAAFFGHPESNFGLPAQTIQDPQETRQLSAFFFWTAWASAARRPGKDHSYTNNFPYDPAVGNHPPSGALLWSAFSLVFLLAGLGVCLLVFGRFNFLGWQGRKDHVHPGLLEGSAGAQKPLLKYCVVAMLLFLAQCLVGAAVAHTRAQPGSFYGLDLTAWLPSNLLRTWHLQLAIFWVATSFVAGGLWLAPLLGGATPKGQAGWTHALFAALVLVVAGSLAGEWLGLRGALGRFWFWFGDQGWEYLDLGRFWQILLALGLALWLVLMVRALMPARGDEEKREISSLFLYSAVAIPLFYLPAMFFGSRSHFTVADMWRFWIIHLWVEGFFELFVTALVAVLFFMLKMVPRQAALRVVYLDAILYLGSGIVGIGHHWYWTGQNSGAMAMAAVFSALEIVPLTLLTLDAWNFVRMSRQECEVCGEKVALPHKWAFMFLMSVGFWNFAGAGVLGFLINLPVVSYFQCGTLLTPNHGHAAMMGVFGMLAVALTVFALRQSVDEERWRGPEKLVRLSFWGLNIGLVLMCVLNLFPAGALQLWDVLQNGYWHARSQAFTSTLAHIEWMRMPADLVFLLLGCLPLVLAAVWVYSIQLSVEPAHAKLKDAEGAD